MPIYHVQIKQHVWARYEKRPVDQKETVLHKSEKSYQSPAGDQFIWNLAVDFPDTDYFEIEEGFEENQISRSEQVDADDSNSQKISQQKVSDVVPDSLGV